MIALPAVALATKIKIAAICAAAVILVSACMLRDASLRKEGATEVVAEAKQQSKKNAEQSRKAHEKARAPGAADRLRRDSCRDC
jgi:predicted small secreted protein